MGQAPRSASFLPRERFGNLSVSSSAPVWYPCTCHGLGTSRRCGCRSHPAERGQRTRACDAPGGVGGAADLHICRRVGVACDCGRRGALGEAIAGSSGASWRPLRGRWTGCGGHPAVGLLGFDRVGGRAAECAGRQHRARAAAVGRRRVATIPRQDHRVDGDGAGDGASGLAVERVHDGQRKHLGLHLSAGRVHGDAHVHGVLRGGRRALAPGTTRTSTTPSTTRTSGSPKPKTSRRP